jgi:hypothetical protein
LAYAASQLRPDEPPKVASTPRRKPPQRGKAGGRTKSRMVYLTDAEEKQLVAKATAAGLSAASYLRASALGDSGVKARRAPTMEKQVLSAAIAELNKVGSNVNQIARALNRGRGHDEDYLQATAAELRAVLAQMTTAFFV